MKRIGVVGLCFAALFSIGPVATAAAAPEVEEFSLSAGGVEFSAAGLETVKCGVARLSSTARGNLTGMGKLTGCATTGTPAVQCGNTAKAGEFVTNALSATFGYAGKKATMSLATVAAGGLVGEFTCGTATTKVRGTIVFEVSTQAKPTAKTATTATYKLLAFNRVAGLESEPGSGWVAVSTSDLGASVKIRPEKKKGFHHPW